MASTDFFVEMQMSDKEARLSLYHSGPDGRFAIPELRLPGSRKQPHWNRHIMPGFVRCLKMPAGLDAVVLYPSAVLCPVWACLFCFSVDKA